MKEKDDLSSEYPWPVASVWQALNKHLWEADRHAGQKESIGLQAHLGGRHILKGHMAIGQLTGCDSHTVDVRLGIITLQILSQEKKATDHSVCSLGGVNTEERERAPVPKSGPAAASAHSTEEQLLSEKGLCGATERAGGRVGRAPA